MRTMRTDQGFGVGVADGRVVMVIPKGSRVPTRRSITREDFDRARAGSHGSRIRIPLYVADDRRPESEINDTVSLGTLEITEKRLPSACTVSFVLRPDLKHRGSGSLFVTARLGAVKARARVFVSFIAPSPAEEDFLRMAQHFTRFSIRLRPVSTPSPLDDPLDWLTDDSTLDPGELEHRSTVVPPHILRLSETSPLVRALTQGGHCSSKKQRRE